MALVPGTRNKSKPEWTEAGPDKDGVKPLSAPSRRADDARARDFDALYARYEKPLFNLIFRWIGTREDAEDVAMETWISAFKAWEGFRGDAQVYTWLVRIAHNHSINRFKQRDRQREMEGPSLDAGLTIGDGEEIGASREIADWSYSPSQLLDQKETRVLIERAIDGLASEYKVVLLLREMENLSYNEIADVTGLTLETVKTRLNRARAMVRQRVEPLLQT